MEDSKISPPKTIVPALKTESSTERETERSLVGSLTDSYAFKDGGLVKKTLSVNLDNVHYHLVSYYKPEDVTNGLLIKPMNHPQLRQTQIRHDLLHRQNFRVPIDDMEDSTQSPYNHARGNSSYQSPHGSFPVHTYLSPTSLPPPISNAYYANPMSDPSVSGHYYMPHHQTHQGYQSPQQHQPSYASSQHPAQGYVDHRLSQQPLYTNSPHSHQGYLDETQAQDVYREERHHSYASYQDDRHNPLSAQTYGETSRVPATATPPTQYGHYSISPVHQQLPVRTSEYPQYPATSYQDQRAVEPPQQYTGQQAMPGWHAK